MRKTTSYRRRGGMLTLVLLLIAAIAVLLFGTQRCRRRPLVRRGGARTAVIRRPLAPARARRSTRMPLVAAVVAIVAATAAATLLFGGRHGTLDTSATVPLGGALPEPVAVERSPRVDAVERALDHGQRASVRSGLRELPSVSPDERIYAEPEATEPEPLMAADEGAGVVGELVSVADGEPPAEAAPEEPVVASAVCALRPSTTSTATTSCSTIRTAIRPSTPTSPYPPQSEPGRACAVATRSASSATRASR